MSSDISTVILLKELVQESYILPLQNALPWPPNAVSDGNYTVLRPESVMYIPYLRLPDRFRLSLASDVDRIEWTIGRLEFGQDCTLCLARYGPDATPKPMPPAPKPIEGEAQPYQQGAQGSPGVSGLPGDNGRPLTLIVEQVVIAGSLWIDTSGGEGGPGGPGGTGQKGGDNPRCQGVNRSNGGRGGKGGRGGISGKGGDTSSVDITINSFPAGLVLRPEACASRCGTVQRPPNASGDDGRIVIYGARGCPFGNPSAGGQGGPGGGKRIQCAEFPANNYFGNPGQQGDQGDVGAAGVEGACGSVVIKGPPRIA